MSKEVVLEITDLAYGGKGVGRTKEGEVCFVRDVISGEKIVARIVRDKSDFAEAELVQIEESSADRVIPPCEYFGRCGGCVYQHMTYPAQLSAKEKQVAITLQRIGNFSTVPMMPILSGCLPYDYRNRITVHTQGGNTGFYERNGRTIVDISHCKIASEAVNQELIEYRKKKPQDGIRTLYAHTPLAGFRQTNDAVAALLLEEVAKKVGEGELLVDAYCGAGFFAQRVRAQFQRVIGVEWNDRAVAAAQAKSLAHESYWKGDVVELLPSALACASAENTVVLLNPPSQGLDSQVISTLLAHLCKRILYISCNAATLARDLKRLTPSFRLASITPLDMFPQTAQIEIIAVLEQY